MQFVIVLTTVVLLRFEPKISASSLPLPLPVETGDAIDESSLPELIFLLSNYFANEYDTFRPDARCQLISIDRINYFSHNIFVNETLFIFPKIKTFSSIIRYDFSFHLFNAPDMKYEIICY